jgi:hypothetical protein
MCVLSLCFDCRCNLSEYFKTTFYHFYYVHLCTCNTSQTTKMILMKPGMVHLHLNFCWAFWFWFHWNCFKVTLLSV